MNKLKMMIVGALAVAGAWCAQAGETYLEPVFAGAKDASAVTGYETKTVSNYTTLTGSHGETTLNAGWYVVSGDVSYSTALHIEGDVKLILKNGAVLTVNSGKSNNGGFRIEGDSKLAVYAQAIDGPRGKILAYGGIYGAGIGGGQKSTGQNITINGGIVEAYGGIYGAGIGGGKMSTGQNITINGGQVTAKGGNFGAGIGGGGWVGAGKQIAINGGTVYAYGAGVSAGIGGGGGAGEGITIRGGIVEAHGGSGAAGIGGSSGHGCNGITISGGEVKAYGGENGAGIGGGHNGDANNITISGGTVTATGNHAAGIGAGRDAEAHYITISGGTVTANGGNKGAGIGGADKEGDNNASCDHVTISGGIVTAKGGDYAADIGGGNNGNGTSITISGGLVKVDSDRVTAHSAIGGGNNAYGKDITISGGTVYAKTESGSVAIGGNNSSENIHFTGGSIKLLRGKTGQPTDIYGNIVYETTVTHLTESSETISGLGGYGVNDLYPDDENKLYFYLPLSSTDYTFTSATHEYSGAANRTIDPVGGKDAYNYGVSVSTDGGKNWADVGTGGGTGASWTFEKENGLLKLKHAITKKDYMITGTNRAGLVRIEVKSKANVTLDNLTMPYTKSDADCITFTSDAKESELILKGTSTVYSQNGYAAIDIADKATVTIKGDGTLVGGKAAGVDSRCVNVEAGGTLVMDDGTISGYTHSGEGGAIHCGGTMTMNGGTISQNTAVNGGALYNSGTATVYGGTITDNASVNGGAVYNDGTLNVYGGVFNGNSVKPVYQAAVYGGVYDVTPEGVVVGYAATQVGANYIVAQDLEQKDGKLFGGTYTFNPTDKEYKDAGVKLYQYYEAKKQGTDPETYVVQLGETDVKVNGVKISKGSGEGWTFVGATLTLSSATNYTVTGKSESPFVIDVTAKAAVTLKDLKDILNTPGREAIRISADTTLTLDGDSTLYTNDGNPAIAVKSGATLTLSGNGTLVGGKSASANGRCVTVEAGGTLVMDGGTIRDYANKDGGGAIHIGGTLTMNGGTISGCETTYNGGAIYNSGTLTIFGGTIENCHSTRYAGAIADGSGHYTYIYGGTFKGNKADIASPFLDSYQSQVTGYLYGGVWVGNDYDPSKDPEVSRQGGTAVWKVDGNYLVAKGLTQRDGKLTGGTYTFDPTDKEYKDAGVKLETGYVVTAQGGSPATYEIGLPPTGFTVNGIDICKKSGDGWTYDDVTGLLALNSGMSYKLTGDGSAVGLGVSVDKTMATVVLSNATITASNHAPLTVNAEDVKVELIGENTLTAQGETAAIAVSSDASVTMVVFDRQQTTNVFLTAVGGEGKPAIGGEGDVAIKSGTIVAQGGINGANVTINGGIITAVGGEGMSGIGDNDAKVTIDGGTIVAQGNGVADIDGNVIICGGSVQADLVTNPKNEEDGEAVFRVTVPDVTQAGPLEIKGDDRFFHDYGQTDLYPIGDALYIWMPNGFYNDFYVGEDPREEEYAYDAMVSDEPTIAYRTKFDIYVNGEQVTEEGGTGWSFDNEGRLTLTPGEDDEGTTNSYVITGTATDGNLLSIIVAGSCDVTAADLQLGINDDYSLDENLLQIGDGDVECTVNLTITGASAFVVPNREGAAPLGVKNYATLNFRGSATIRKWDIDVDDDGRVTAEDSAALTFTSEADAKAAAEVIKPAADTEDFPGINQLDYADMFTVSYVEGAVEGTWTLRYSPTTETETEIEASFPAAETTLAQNLKNDNPSTTIDGVEGFYYGLASATSAEELDDAEPGTWYASQGGETAISGSIFPGCGKVYYQIRATRLPGEVEVAGDNTVATTDTGVKVDGVDVAQGTGEGWKYDAVGKVLTLMDSQAYVLSGGNTAGKVRVEVTATDVAVTLKDLSLIAEAPAADLISFASGVTNATLTLSGVNTIYATNELAAISVAAGATLTVSGEGALVGGKSVSARGRGAYVSGTLNWNGGTLRDYYNQKEGSTQEKGAGVRVTTGGTFNLNGGTISGMLGYEGGAFYNMGTVNMTGGVVSGNCAVFGSAFYSGTGANVNLYGGVVKGNGATGATGVLCTGTGTITVYGGVVSGNIGKSLTYKCTFNLSGGVFDKEPTGATYVSGYKCEELMPSEYDSLYVVGKDVEQEGEDIPQLTKGTYTFCPTNAEYVAAYEGNLLVKPGTPVAQMKTTPVTWVLGEVIVYPDYLAGYGYAVTNTFKKWAKAYPPGDPDGIYTNAFLLNVAQNREAEAVAAFKIGSIVVTNEVVGTVTNTVVVVEVAKPLKPAVMFNGDTWLQCATNGLGEAGWLDIEGGRYTEKGKSFFIQRIDFEHKLTPEAFPEEPEGTKTMKVKLVE